MNNKGNVGVSTIPILTIFMLVGATSSVMFEDSNDLSKDAEKIVNDAIKEITTYLKIDDVIGKYFKTNGTHRVEKIVLLVKPLVQTTINISELTIKIYNNNDLKVFHYSGYTAECNSKAVFEHQLWKKTNHSFSLIVILDKDRSLLDYNIMNEDTAFIAIKLPERFTMRNDESITISIIPARGITRTIVLKTPSVHTSNIISFKEV